MSTPTHTDGLCRIQSHIKVLNVPCLVPRTKRICGSTDRRYLFFEKKRIAEGKPKSPSRLQVERRFGWIATKIYVYEIRGQEEECFEDGKGRLYLKRTGKAVKLI